MTTTATTASTGNSLPLPPKWWGDSMTIGFSLPPDLVLDAGSNIAAAVQAVVALAGTAATIYGRVRATQPLERRLMTLKI